MALPIPSQALKEPHPSVDTFASNPRRVLFVEDSKFDYELIPAALARERLALQSTHVTATTVATGLAFLAVQHHIELEIAGNDNGNGNGIGGLNASKRRPGVVGVHACARVPHSTPNIANKLRVGTPIVSSVFFVICAIRAACASRATRATRATPASEPFLSTAYL